MKTILNEDGFRMLRFDPGEEVLSLLAAFAEGESISAGAFTGIGAAEGVVVSYYDLARKEYEDHEIKDRVEIASLIGNIARLDGRAIIHVHGVFAGRDLAAVAGHVKKLIVSATCEVALHLPGGRVHRAPDSATGLNLLS